MEDRPWRVSPGGPAGTTGTAAWSWPGLRRGQGTRDRLRPLGDQFRPQLGAGGAVRFLGQDRERLGAHLDGDPGVGYEVVVPARVGGRSAVGSPDRAARSK